MFEKSPKSRQIIWRIWAKNFLQKFQKLRQFTTFRHTESLQNLPQDLEPQARCYLLSVIRVWRRQAVQFFWFGTKHSEDCQKLN